MHNKKNIVLMFLIVMLSFAIISEVSAAIPEEAEPGESGLNEPIGSFNSSGHEMPRERFQEVSALPDDDAIDAVHSNTNQTSLRDVHETSDNRNLYEQNPSMDEGLPLEQKNHMDDEIHHGEKMDNMTKVDFNILRSDNRDAGQFMDNESVEVSDKVISNLIGMNYLSAALKNNRTENPEILPEFNGVLPQEFDKNIISDDLKGDFIQFDMDLNLNNPMFNGFLPNISIPNNELPEIDDTVGDISNNTQFPKKDIFPLLFNSFLPNKDIKHKSFNNTHILEMPNSIHKIQ